MSSVARTCAILIVVVGVMGVLRPVAADAADSATKTEVIAAVQFDRVGQQVLNYRPGSTIGVHANPDGSWSAWIREPGDTRDLASFRLQGDPPRVVRRAQLPLDRYPPRMTQREAIGAARASSRAAQAARAFGGLAALTATAHWKEGTTWEVSFWKERTIVVRVDIHDQSATIRGVWTGHAIGWEMARGGREAFGGAFSRPWVWYTSMALFVLVLLDRRRILSWRTADIALLLSFVISHEFYIRGMLEWSVPLAWGSLFALFVRSCIWFVRGDRSAVAQHTKDAAPGSVVVAATASQQTVGAAHRAAVRWWRRDIPTVVLVLLVLFAGGARIGINLWGSSVVDVGYAGVAGANAILAGDAPYGNMPPDNKQGDTYGPLNYLAYVPAAALWDKPSDNEWEQGLPAAHAVAIAADLLAVALLAAIGWRWFSARAAALLAAGWMTYPYTGWTLASNVNDTLVAACVLAALLALPRAWLRGALLGCAAAVKFVPLIALSVLAHAGLRRRRLQAIQVAVGASVVIGLSLVFIAMYPAGLSEFWTATFGFQLDRSSPFSPWGLYGWDLAQRVAQVVVVGMFVIAAMVPRVRDARQVAGGVVAALVASQLVLQHWFYLYIPWFVGPALIVLIGQRESRALPAVYARTHEHSDLSLLANRHRPRIPARSS